MRLSEETLKVLALKQTMLKQTMLKQKMPKLRAITRTAERIEKNEEIKRQHNAKLV